MIKEQISMASGTALL